MFRLNQLGLINPQESTRLHTLRFQAGRFRALLLADGNVVYGMLEDLAALCRPEGNVRVRENAHAALTALLTAVRTGRVTLMPPAACNVGPSSWQLYTHLLTTVAHVHSLPWCDPWLAFVRRQRYPVIAMRPLHACRFRSSFARSRQVERRSSGACFSGCCGSTASGWSIQSLRPGS